ncbi:MAG: efflux RND transporter periplasmic adaptor subunit [Roseovarius sp.]|nr:efflux RND transporter periplasmic adaptor subunit [Roseovarius sp.]
MNLNTDADTNRAILDSLSDGVLVIHRDGLIKMASPSFRRMFDLPRGEEDGEEDKVVGRHFHDLFLLSEGLDEFTDAVLTTAAERGEARRQITQIRTGDEVRFLTVTSTAIDTATHGAAVLVVVSDITEIRELRETEVRQAALIEDQLSKLKTAYRDLESRNEALSALSKRVRTVRGGATLFVVGLFLAIGTWYLRPLDLFGGVDISLNETGFEGISETVRPTLSVTPQNFSSTLDLRGTLSPERVMDVVSPIEGHVKEIYADPGDVVSEGDALVELDTGALTTELRQAEIEHIRARDRLDELEDWESGSEVVRARRALRRAQVAGDDSEQKLANAQFLISRGLIPASQLEEAERAHESRKFDVEEAERELEAVRAKGVGESLQVAILQAKTAEERLRAQQEKLTMSHVRAPIAGVVIADEGPQSKPLTRGRAVTQGERLLSIADMDRFSVVTTIDEVDLHKVKPGQQAWITGPGFPGLRVPGRVDHVSQRAVRSARQGGGSQFEVIVVLDELGEDERNRLRVGMSAFMTIVVYDRPSALLVPISAVEQREGKKWIQVLKPDNLYEFREVETGLTSLDSVEILDGLSPGDQIVLPQ